MAQQLETKLIPRFIPLSSLRDENVYKALLAENRTPAFIRSGTLSEGEELEVDAPEVVRLFIPPSQSLDISIADAKELISIRDKLKREI